MTDQTTTEQTPLPTPARDAAKAHESMTDSFRVAVEMDAMNTARTLSAKEAIEAALDLPYYLAPKGPASKVTKADAVAALGKSAWYGSDERKEQERLDEEADIERTVITGIKAVERNLAYALEQVQKYATPEEGKQVWADRLLDASADYIIAQTRARLWGNVEHLILKEKDPMTPVEALECTVKYNLHNTLLRVRTMSQSTSAVGRLAEDARVEATARWIEDVTQFNRLGRL